jgi:hypothetical protein
VDLDSTPHYANKKKKLPGFGSKFILAADLIAKHRVWDSKISNPSRLKLLELFVSSNFEISTAHCSTHYTPDGRCDVLVIVVHRNDRLSEVTVTNILDSAEIPMIFSILDPVRTSEGLDPVEKLTDWELGALSLNSYIRISKFTLLMKLIKQYKTFKPLQLRQTGYRLEKNTISDRK